MIQDYVLTIGGLVFFVVLFPALRDYQKPPVVTSLTTAIVLTVFSVTQFTLELVLTSIMTMLTSGVWYLLAWQRFNQKESN